MGGYALPALDIKTPQHTDLLEKFSQLQQLRGQQQQQQMLQQEAPLRMQALQQNNQQGQLDIQQKQQALDDQRATTSALHDWKGEDLNELPSLILKHGGSATAVMGMKTHVLEQKAKISAIAKDDATTGKNQIETQMQKNNALSGALGSILQVPDEQLSQAITATAQQLTEQGVLDPQHGQAAQQLAQLPPAQARQQLDIMRKGVTSNTQLLEQTKQEQTAANEKAMREQAAVNEKNTAAHQRVEERQGQQRISIEGARLEFDKKRQGTQDQQSIEAQAQQMATGELKLPPQGRNNPLNSAIRARAFEINPQLSDELYATKQDFLSSKGKANAQVQSLNKLSAHLGELRSASENAGFSPVGFTAAGKDLRLAEQLFSKEDVKFLSGSGVGTEGELNGLIEKTHSPIQSVRDSAIDTLSKFTADAARQLGDQFERGTKLKFDPNQHFTPVTVDMMNKHGGTSARGGQAAPQGQQGGAAPEGTIVQTQDGPKIKRGGQWVKP